MRYRHPRRLNLGAYRNDVVVGYSWYGGDWDAKGGKGVTHHFYKYKTTPILKGPPPTIL